MTLVGSCLVVAAHLSVHPTSRGLVPGLRERLERDGRVFLVPCPAIFALLCDAPIKIPQLAAV